jgi:hypothetical protein
MAWLPVNQAAPLLGARSNDEMYNWGKRGTNGHRRRESPDGWLYWVPDELVEADTAVVVDEVGGSALEDLARMAGRKTERAPSPPPRQERRTRDLKMACVINDWHVPVHHIGFTDAVLDWLAENQPDTLVINGDFVDLEAASSHGGNPSPPNIRDEMEQGNAMLDRIDEALPLARKVFGLGNHETRLQRALTQLMPTLYGAIEIADLLDLEGRGYEVADYMEPVHLGGFTVVHGSWCPKNYAGKYLRDYGMPAGGGLGLGHTHRPQVMTRNNRGGFGAVYGFGHGCDEGKAAYLKRTPSDWVMGFGVVYYDDVPGGRWAAYQVLAPDGSFVWGGRVYG